MIIFINSKQNFIKDNFSNFDNNNNNREKKKRFLTKFSKLSHINQTESKLTATENTPISAPTNPPHGKEKKCSTPSAQ